MQLRKALEPGDKFRVFWEKGAADSPVDMADYNDHWLEVISTSSKNGAKGLVAAAPTLPYGKKITILVR